jgi:hypothetical protein
MFRGVETDQLQRAFEIGEALIGGKLRAEPLAAPFGERMQGRVLQELRRGPFDPGVRRLPETGAKLLDEPRFADPRLADDQRELAFARARTLPAPPQKIELFLAPDERRRRTMR